jgi:hypothetical protein
MARHGQQRQADRISAWRRALVLVLLVAASAQQLVAQTHWHSPVVAQAEAGLVSPGNTAPDTRHHDCLLCQIAAHASAAAPPASTQLAVVVSELLAERVPAASHLVVIRKPAHAWQSRGPPTV